MKPDRDEWGDFFESAPWYWWALAAVPAAAFVGLVAWAAWRDCW